MLMAVLPMKAQQVVCDNFQQLKVHYRTPNLNMDIVPIDNAHAYYRLSADGYAAGGEIGTPELPQLSSLIVVPFCKEMKVEIFPILLQAPTSSVKTVTPDKEATS